MKRDLIDTAGKVRKGVFKQPIHDVNYMDFPLRNSMDKLVPDWRKKLAFNQFEFVGAMSRDVIFGLAIVDLKLVSNLFFYLYTFSDDQLQEFSLTVPGGVGTSVGTQPDQSPARFRLPGIAASIVPDEQGGRSVDVRSRTCSVDLRLEAENAFSPLRVCSGAGKHRWVYTQKAAGLTVSGNIHWGTRCIELKPGEGYGSYDWTAGFMRRETFWNWACFSGLAESGDKIGLNLATGVNESGVTENGVWVNDAFFKIDFAEFDYDTSDIHAPWTVRTSKGEVDLRFYPVGERKEKLNAWMLASNFRQLFGHFTGQICVAGKTMNIESMPGVVEDHFARW